MKKSILLLSIVLFLAIAATSQNYQPQRVDIKVKDDWEKFNTIACGENGVITYYFKYSGSGIFSSNKKLHVTLYDKELNKKWEKSKKVNSNFSIIDYVYDETKEEINLLFVDEEGSGLEFSKDTKAEIIKIKPESDRGGNKELISITKHSLAIPSKNSYENMLITGDNLFLFLQERRSPILQQCCRPFSTIKRWTSSTPKDYIYKLSTEKDFANKQLSIEHKGKYYQHISSFVDKNDNIIFLASIHDVANSGEVKQKLYNFDNKSGKVKEKYDVSKIRQEKLSYPAAIQHGEKVIFAGLYGEEDNSAQTRFTFRYFKNSELLDEKEYSLKKLTGKDNRKKILGIFNSKKSMNMRFHNKTYQLNDEGHFMIIGERLSPEYETHTYIDAQGNMSTRVEHVGWTYHEAYLMAFDNDNKPLWSKTFDMKNTTVNNLSFIPRLFVKELEENNIMLMFGIGKKIATMHIDEGQPLEQKITTLRSQFKKSRTSSDVIPSIEHWYNDYFIASGFIDVDRGDSFLSGEDKVYYFTKLKLED